MFIPDGDQIVSKTDMTRVEGENTRRRHYLARLQCFNSTSASVLPEAIYRWLDALTIMNLLGQQDTN